MNTTSVIVAIAVIVASAAARLVYYIWWRGAVGGRPIRFRKTNPGADFTIVRWPERPAALPPHSGPDGERDAGAGSAGGGGDDGVAAGRRDSLDR